ncbi:MAG: M48 family metallopeptidase [Bacteroidota bacterium]|jgi:predicted Zn-dependent protease|nr:M48 family metallopeptidase [Flavisolibacter sp.]MDQ3552392.1 M48 family metallopeptidase [Bacteroidota bacterium]
MLKRISALVLLVVALVGCSTNPVTNRKQFTLVSEQELQSMANQQYRQFLGSNPVVSASSNKDAAMVRRVGNRLASAVTSYYKANNLPNVLDGYKWEFNLVRDNSANAWAMPGGKVVVHTGLLPITQNEAALANVLGHEISHAIFRHGNERMSQGLVQQLGGAALSVALANRPAQTQNLFMQAFGVGSAVGVLLPFARKHELEADRYGMRWAAMAGYNPQEAINLWRRMEQQASAGRPPDFLSTHPSEGRRIQELERYLPEARKYYKPMK